MLPGSTMYKNNQNLAVGELSIIPWLDFTESWDDEKLFEKFDVSEELQKYIREFLPDYYNIRGWVRYNGFVKFDIIFTNPPYNKNIDISILNGIIQYTQELVAIHPSLWLMDKKRNNSTFNSLRDKINVKVRSLELFNGNKIFGGITVNSPIVVTYVDNKYSGDIAIDYFGEEYAQLALQQMQFDSNIFLERNEQYKNYAQQPP